ncbi:MAG: TetR/AcrR family transcriptional regulator, partial [Endomicrobia bacterium]|nr:TetR/AcrR family transcriptional regulator [Endomicrobiia bacterium]
VFFYFKTKENLFKQILYSLIKDIYILIEKILNEKLSPIEKLKKIYDSYIEFQLQNMNLFNSLRKILSTENPKIEEVKEKLLNISQQMIPLIEEMLNKGLIKKIDPTIPLAEVVPSMLMMYASAVSTMVFFYPNNINKIKDIFWEVLLHGILHEEVSVRMTMFNEKI